MSHLSDQKRDEILVWVEDLIGLQMAAGLLSHLPSDYLIYMHVSHTYHRKARPSATLF